MAAFGSSADQDQGLGLVTKKLFDGRYYGNAVPLGSGIGFLLGALDGDFQTSRVEALSNVFPILGALEPKRAFFRCIAARAIANL